jgi:integrase/recombinase XerD
VENRYATCVQQQYHRYATPFIRFLEEKGLAITNVGPPDVNAFLRWELRRWQSRFGRAPRNLHYWRDKRLAAVHMLLRVVNGHWPMQPAPQTALQAFHRGVASSYDAWMRDMRGLRQRTRAPRVSEALRFLAYLGPQGDELGLKCLTIEKIDAYVIKCCAGKRRATIQGQVANIRSFLDYLHRSKRTQADLSSSVIKPHVYDKEDIPSALPTECIRKLLDATRKDPSNTGVRDYAFMTLLATYGLRCGEILALRLDDINWRGEAIHIRHSKTDAYTELPLLPVPGEAILNYLKKARPKSTHREIFLQLKAPYAPYKAGCAVYNMMRARLSEIGASVPGRRGPHAIRHARAANLLQNQVSLKTIGDILGHESPESTTIYLKLATEPLREVGLDVRAGVTR